MIPWLTAEHNFPPLASALHEPNGLLAAGGDLTPQRLLAAYRLGIFPWYSEGQPILWWSPDPRMVLFPDQLKVSRSLAKRLRKADYEIRMDTAFTEVVHACATVERPGQDGTWITPAMVRSYCYLFDMGYAHSVETWIEGRLAGGIYGVAVGRIFFAESMFHYATDASKIAFVRLVEHLKAHDFGMMDCQMKTTHLASLGAREITRNDFILRLSDLIHYNQIPAKW